MKAKSFLVLLLMTGFFVFGGQSYADDLYLGGTLASGTYYAPNGSTITTNPCIIPAGSAVIFMPDQKAILRAGFSVKAGGQLSIKAGRALDADNDGLPDWWEIAYFGSIALYGANDDPDGDGLTNLQEYLIHGDPKVYDTDTDNDGLNDVWELVNFGNLNQVAEGDADADGFNNYVEYMGGSNPNSSASKPKPGTYYRYDSLGRITKIYKVK
jgi:hypothetical protein